MSKFISILMSIWIFLCPMKFNPRPDIAPDEWNTNYDFVYVHGLSGWGSYDAQYKLMPYWGMFGGNLLKYLSKQGFNCYAASVAPSDSAWDRACELYAQLTGTVTDYGKAHSEKCSHERFGPDFTGRALIKNWSAEAKINLLGHSFGGATVRTLVSLMAVGSEEERAATAPEEISPLFTGGKADYIHAVVTLAAPHNGTTAYNTGDSTEEVETDKLEDAMGSLVSKANGTQDDGRAAFDYASYDMYIDNALELNKNLALPENIYYFSIACSSTQRNEDGTYDPVDVKTEILFRSSASQMGHFTGVTRGGFVIDESWQENDGLVNTCSALAPMYQPSAEYVEGAVVPGVWNIMPVYDGDHMSLQGGLFVKNDVRVYHAELLDMINRL